MQRLSLLHRSLAPIMQALLRLWWAELAWTTRFGVFSQLRPPRPQIAFMLVGFDPKQDLNPQFTASSSTVKVRSALGGMTRPAPEAP